MEKTLRKKRERICLRSPFAVVPEPSAFVLFVLGTLLLFGKDFRARLTITLADVGSLRTSSPEKRRLVTTASMTAPCRGPDYRRLVSQKSSICSNCGLFDQSSSVFGEALLGQMLK